MLTVDAIDVYYGPVQALRGVSLEVNEGEMVALLGANGAGKTTTLRAVSSLVPVARGTVVYNGTELSRMKAHHVVNVGVVHVPEGRELFTNLSVLDNLRMGYWTKRSDKGGYQAQLDVVMDHFPILRERADQAAGTLSGGEQQMLVVARALMSSPSLLLLDELSLGLAPKIVSQLFDILREVNRSTGTSMVLVEQFVHMALAHTDRAYVLAKGEVVASDVSSGLLADPALIASYLGSEAAGEAPAVERPAADAAPADAAAPKRRRSGRPAAS